MSGRNLKGDDGMGKKSRTQIEGMRKPRNKHEQYRTTGNTAKYNRWAYVFADTWLYIPIHEKVYKGVSCNKCRDTHLRKLHTGDWGQTIAPHLPRDIFDSCSERKRNSQRNASKGPTVKIYTI